MKCSSLFVFVLSVILLVTFGTPVWAMPPNPTLLQRIENGEIQKPYYLEHNGELREQGLNSPTKIQRACDIASGRLRANYYAIAILVDFSDNIAVTPTSYFDTLLYEDQTGTMRDFWDEATYGNLTVITFDLPSALGWKRAPHTYDYYVDGQNGFGWYPHNAQKLAEDAVILADPFVDFSDYDNDGDGYVDALFIIHAGPGAEFTGSDDDIWSHKWEMVIPQSVDGVTAYVYSMEPEYWEISGDMTCGVYAHEMGHSVFGLPDLYDYDYDSRGAGRWSLMAFGSWNGPAHMGESPAHPDVWCRVQMGVVTPTVVSTCLLGASIPAIVTTPTAYRLWTDGGISNEFMIIENRQQSGYDTYLPSEGLLIYHVDETQYGNDNQWYPGYTEYGHYLVALEQADGDWDMEQYINSGDDGDPYPGSINNRTYDNNSTPDSKDYDFNNTWVAVRNISDVAPVMTADLYVTPTPFLVISISGGNAVLNWLPFGATYEIYGATAPFVTGSLLDTVTNTVWTDVNTSSRPSPYFYYVKAVE